ncbi:hypothetical protein CEXT_261521 [Caerostris extrusa]|uniref:Uncharacterized protein n=1 Tax=Caerostris extrusa TaxID=172846 RepID=A0AAV4SPY9_CAEEX|nr:hypothetical protein CEXT_261521 [Caerostris extrusa]
MKEEKESQNWMTLSAKATRSRNSFYEQILRILLVSAQQLELLIGSPTASRYHRYSEAPVYMPAVEEKNVQKPHVVKHGSFVGIAQNVFQFHHIKFKGLHPNWDFDLVIDYVQISEVVRVTYLSSKKKKMMSSKKKMFKNPHVVKHASLLGIAQNVLYLLKNWTSVSVEIDLASAQIPLQYLPHSYIFFFFPRGEKRGLTSSSLFQNLPFLSREQ